MVLKYYRIALWLAGAQVGLALALLLALITGLVDTGFPGMNTWLPIWFAFQGLATALMWWLMRGNSLYDANPCSTQERVLLFTVSGAITFFYLFLAALVHFSLGGLSLSPAILLIDLWALLAISTFVLLVVAHQTLPPHVVPEPRPRQTDVMRQVVAGLRERSIRPEYQGDIPGGERAEQPDMATPTPEPEAPAAISAKASADEDSPAPQSSRFEPPAGTLPLAP